MIVSKIKGDIPKRRVSSNQNIHTLPLTLRKQKRWGKTTRYNPLLIECWKTGKFCTWSESHNIFCNMQYICGLKKCSMSCVSFLPVTGRLGTGVVGTRKGDRVGSNAVSRCQSINELKWGICENTDVKRKTQRRGITTHNNFKPIKHVYMSSSAFVVLVRRNTVR